MKKKDGSLARRSAQAMMEMQIDPWGRAGTVVTTVTIHKTDTSITAVIESKDENPPLRLVYTRGIKNEINQ